MQQGFKAGPWPPPRFEGPAGVSGGYQLAPLASHSAASAGRGGETPERAGPPIRPRAQPQVLWALGLAGGDPFCCGVMTSSFPPQGVRFLRRWRVRRRADSPYGLAGERKAAFRHFASAVVARRCQPSCRPLPHRLALSGFGQQGPRAETIRRWGHGRQVWASDRRHRAAEWFRRVVGEGSSGALDAPVRETPGPGHPRRMAAVVRRALALGRAQTVRLPVLRPRGVVGQRCAQLARFDRGALAGGDRAVGGIFEPVRTMFTGGHRPP